MHPLIILLVGIWLIALASVALHEVLNSPGENYQTFVKWFSGVSIGVGVLIVGYTAWNMKPLE